MATTDPYLQYLQDYNAGTTSPTTGGLQNKLQEKIQNTQIKKATLLGLEDADTPLISGIGGLRETPTGLPTNTRYDAVELQHGNAPYDMYGSTGPEDTNKKSRFAMSTQRTQASRILGIPENNLTSQDMIDVGNQQQIQKLADLVRSPDQPRWEAPLIRGTVQTNLTGTTADESGNLVKVPLDIPVGVELTGETDMYNRKLGAVYNSGTGENITNLATADRSQNAFAKASPSDIAAAVSAGLSKAAEPSFAEEVVSLPGAAVSGVTKAVLGTADFVTDLSQRGINKALGTDFSGGIMEQSTIDKIADTLAVGYDAKQDKDSMQRANESWSIAFKDVDITKPSTYKNVLDLESARATSNALLEYAKNPSLAAESLGQILPGFGVKAVGQKITQKAIEKYGSDALQETLDKSAKAYDELAAIKASSTLSSAEKAAKAGEITKEIDTLSKIGKAVSSAVPAVSYAANITNQQMEEFKNNNNGVEMSTDRVLGTLVANTLAFAVPEIATTKIALGMNPIANKAVADNVKGAVNRAFTTLAVGGIAEVPQEMIEGVVETVSTRLGTEKYKDKTVQEVVGEATAEILGGALGGGVGGVHMATPRAANIVWNGGKLGVGALGKDAPVGLEGKRQSYRLDEEVLANTPEEYKPTRTRDIIEYATLMITDPEEAKASGYEQGKVNLADVVDKIAKVNGISDENKEYIYSDVMAGIKNTLVRNTKGATTEEKLSVFKELVPQVEETPEAKRAVNDVIEDLVADELSGLSAKVSDALSKNVDLSTVKIRDEEKVKIDSVLNQMKEMGSEELRSKADAIEEVIRGLGKKKTYAEVRNDIEKAGFVFYGKGYKSLGRHEGDIKKEIATGSGVKETNKLAEFVKSRKDARVKFEKDQDGVIKDRTLGELVAFTEINNTDNISILNTINGLLSKAKEGTKNKEILETSKAELEGMIAKFDELAKSKNLEEFKARYEGKEPEVVIEEETKVEPTLEDRQNAFVDKIINKADGSDEALVVLNTSKSIEKIPAETRSKLEDRIRNAEKFKKAEVKQEKVVEPEVVQPAEVVKEVEAKVETEEVTPKLDEMTEVEYYKKAQEWTKDKDELKDLKAKLKEAEKAEFEGRYGKESARLFKKVAEDKTTVTNKFTADMTNVQESNKRVGQGNDKRRVVADTAAKIAEELVALMPKSVVKMMTKKPEYIKDAMSTFMDYRYGSEGHEGNKRIDIPKQSEGSAAVFVNDWLADPELNARLHMALDVAGVVAMDDMLSVRTLNSSMIEDMITGAFGVTTEDPAFKMIKKDLQKGKYVPMSTFTKSAGVRVVRELGLKFDESQISMQDRQNIEFALGQLALERSKMMLSAKSSPKDIGIVASSIELTEEDGVVTGVSKTEYKEGKDTNTTKRVIELDDIRNVKGLRQLASVLEYASEQSDGELQFEPKVVTKAKVRNSNVEMSQKAVDYINSNNSYSWKFTDEFKELYSKLEEQAKKSRTSVNELMYELLLDDVHDLDTRTVDDVESQLASREAEKLEIDRMLMGYELAGSNKFYLNWDQTISGRYMIANKMINPQNSKIVRFLVNTEDMRSTLVRGEQGYNGKDIAVVKGAIAQAFGYGIDKDSDANVFAKMAKELVNINDNGTEVSYLKGSKLEAAVKKYRQLDIVGAVKELKAIGIEANERMHTLQALKVLSGLEQGQKSISHNLVVEVDAITNGMILTLLEIGSEWAMNMLAKGGIYWGANKEKYSNHGEFKQEGGVDIYQTPVEALVGKVDTGTVVGNMVVELLSKDGKPNMNKWRSALKPLVMVYIYGAGMKSIVSKAGDEFGQLLMSDLIKNKNVEGMQVLLSEAKIDQGKLEFVDKKKLVAGTLQVKQEKLTKANIGNLRLTPYQAYQLNSAVTESLGTAIEESFEESFEEIGEYRKVLKLVEILNYAVFKQELDKLVRDRETITIEELNKLLKQMQKDGTYYGAKNSSGGIQDYVKLGDEGSKAIKVTGFMSKAASGTKATITVNSALKWFKSNIGAVGVTAIHDKDGSVMEESDQDGTLNVYDAKIMPANYRVSNQNSTMMNEAIMNVSRRHSVLAEAVEKLSRIADKLDVENISKELAGEITNDMNRVFGETDWMSGDRMAEQLKTLRDDREANVSKPMVVNHVYALDSLNGANSQAGETRVIELDDKRLEELGKFRDSVVQKVALKNSEKTKDKEVKAKMKAEGMSQEQYDIIRNETKKAGMTPEEVIRRLMNIKC